MDKVKGRNQELKPGMKVKILCDTETHIMVSTVMLVERILGLHSGWYWLCMDTLSGEFKIWPEDLMHPIE